MNLKNNEMIRYLCNLTGNPKYCILTEPLWFIPYSLYTPFATIYMYRLGVDDLQIGFILSAGMLVQVFAAFLGGALTDKFGRRATTIVADLVSWSIPCVIWALAQNFWWFFIAAVFNSVWQVSNISWSGLLVEDSRAEDLVYAYSWINIASVLSVFISPIAFLLMEHFDTVLIVRCLYTFSAISMTIKFLILYFKGHETEQGKLRMQETKDVSFASLLSGYKDVFQKMMRSGQMRFSLFVSMAYNICVSAVTATFFGLYITERLGLSESYLAIFQMIGAAITLAFMFTVQNKLNRIAYRPVMLGGYAIFIVSNLLLVFAPLQNVGYIVCYTVVNAVATACIAPRKDSLSETFIDPKERARVKALIYMIMIGFTSPFGVFIGWLSATDRRLPFVLNIVVYAICFVAMFCSKEVKALDKRHQMI